MAYILLFGTHPDSRDFSRVDMRNSVAAVLLSVASWASADCQSEVIPWPQGSGDLFGSGIAGDAGKIIVGVPNASLDGLFEHGKVLVSNADGILVELPMPPLESGLHVGFDVAVADGYAFASCTGRTDGFNGNVGGVLLWRQLTTDTWSTPQLLSRPDWDDQFFGGYQIAAFNDVLAVSVPGLVGGYPAAAGAVDVWTLAGTNGYEYAGRLSDGSESGSFFGASMALNGSFLVVGAPTIGPGRVHIYDRSGNSFSYRGFLEGIAEGDQFGASVCLHGSTLFVGAPRVGPANVGEAYRFAIEAGLPDPNMTYEAPQNALPNSRFGLSIAGDELHVCATGFLNGRAAVWRADFIDGLPDSMITDSFVGRIRDVYADGSGRFYLPDEFSGDVKVLNPRLDCNLNGICDPEEEGPDCNNNGIPDAPCDVVTFGDCDSNGIPDDCDPDCDGDGVIDACDDDDDNDDIPDDCDANSCGPMGPDCNDNGVLDACDIADGAEDCNLNGVPDACEDLSDCNGNGAPDECEIFDDCNSNGIPDECEIQGNDCDSNGIPDDCQPDCDADGLPDACEVDCNSDGTPDDCQPLSDCDENGTPDVCESFKDCNVNGIPDRCETEGNDCDFNGIPDECDPDCNGDGLPDACETDCNNDGTPDECQDLPDCDRNGTPDICEPSDDCNANNVPDRCELAGNDCDSNGIPDECDPDCDNDGTPDSCEKDCNADGISDDCQKLEDCDENGIPDVCEIFEDCNVNQVPDQCELDRNDCNLSGIPDECELKNNDCDSNGIPDECDPDCDEDSVPDACEEDCNRNGLPDDCDLDQGLSEDCDSNGVPDECDLANGVPDCNGNGVLDVCDLLGGKFDDCNNNGIPDDCDLGLQGGNALINVSFEEFIGSDQLVLDSQIEGLEFTGSNQNAPWTVRDATTGQYNISSWDCASDSDTGSAWGDENYWICDSFAVTTALDKTGNDGLILIPYGASFFELRYASVSELTLIAYDEFGLEVARDSQPSNLRSGGNETGPGLLRVVAKASERITSVRITDSGNYWIVDSFVSDALYKGSDFDCDNNMLIDSCEIDADPSLDCNKNGVLDVCDVLQPNADCNMNGIPDSCDISSGFSDDCDSNGEPDECQLIDGSGFDCNKNSVLDACEVKGGALDQNGNLIPDECECIADLNIDGFVDLLDVVIILGQWLTAPDGLPDINGDGLVDLQDLLLVLDAYGPCEL